MTMRIKFNGTPVTPCEPLVVTGVEYQKDYIYVQNQRPGVVRIGYSHPGDLELISGNINVDPSHNYLLRIQCGSLFPPEGYPAYDGWEKYEFDSLKKWVKIDLDGQNILTGVRGSNEASPGSIEIGRDNGGFYGRRFTGTIEDVRRVGWGRLSARLDPKGEFNVVFTLPTMPMDRVQPLLVAGHPGRADLIGLNLDDQQQYHFVYESWGAGMWRGVPLAIPTDRQIATHIRVGPLLEIDDSSPLKILRRSIVVWEGSKPVFWHHAENPIGPSPPLYLMTNPIGSSAMDELFQGRFISAETTSSPTWKKGSFTALDIRLGGSGDGTQPLLSTGHSGQSDQLAIRWLPGGQAQLVYDHWGLEFKRSRPFDWSETTTHSVRIAMPSLGSLDRLSAGSEARGRLNITVDDTTVWDEDVLYYGAKSDSLSVGHNSCMSSCAGGDLECAVIDVSQVSESSL
jgi:hypothetical protein